MAASRLALGLWPTPLHGLPRLSAELGVRILVKRDDHSGFALGGNKVRKLERLLADALSQGADTVVTAGAAQSNHCRQTAAAAAKAGLGCDLVLGGEEPAVAQGNLLLDRLFGARIHWCGAERRGERLAEIADGLRRDGRKPYVIPYGGSNAIGACGFVDAAAELAEQCRHAGLRVDRIVLASSSGGTQAGLTLGARVEGLDAVVEGISIDKGATERPYREHLAALAEEAAERIGTEIGLAASDFTVIEGYDAAGYGVVTDAEREAIRLCARLEGLVLDPVYTGRAMAALIDRARSGQYGAKETVLFWHTGGTPALFAYAGEMG